MPYYNRLCIWHQFCEVFSVRFSVCAIFVFAAGLLQAETVAPVACELPLQFRDGLLWVEVNVPQSDRPLNFLVDSGASVSVLNLSTARRLGLELGAKVSVNGVRASLSGNW